MIALLLAVGAISTKEVFPDMGRLLEFLDGKGLEAIAGYALIAEGKAPLNEARLRRQKRFERVSATLEPCRNFGLPSKRKAGSF